MNKEFVTYLQALALKELGFDEECFAWYNYGELLEFGNDHILDMYAGEDKKPVAPLKQQVFRWFREKHNLWSSIHPEVYRKEWNYHVQEWSNTEHWGELWQGDSWDTYEEAENACIDKLIEIAKQQSNGK